MSDNPLAWIGNNTAIVILCILALAASIYTMLNSHEISDDCNKAWIVALKANTCTQQCIADNYDGVVDFKYNITRRDNSVYDHPS